MLLTLHANAVRSMLVPSGNEPPDLSLIDLPRFVRESLGLHGLNLPTDMLAGATRDSLGRLRESADRAGCAVLLIIEPDPLPIASADIDEAEAAVERAGRVLRAASVLGCNAAAFEVRAEPDDRDEVFELAVDRLKGVVELAERLELNALLTPNDPKSGGLTAEPDGTAELIKRVGGFRIGALPSFELAMRSDDPETYIRRLTPYAAVVLATTVAFEELAEPEVDESLSPEERMLEAMLADNKVHHSAYPLEPLVRGVVAVGYDGTLAIDYQGEEDPVLGVMNSRAALEDVLDAIAEAG